MRILVLSDLFPPVAFGGYERACAALVGRLRERHQVRVLTSRRDARLASPDPAVRRELPYVGPRSVEVGLAPANAVRAAKITRRTITAFRPELVYVANATAIPQASVCVAAGERLPMVHRLSELWYAGHLYAGDRFLRHLGHEVGDDPERGGRVRALWSRALRLANRHPSLRIDPTVRVPAAVSWSSDALRSLVTLSPPIEPVLERTIYSATESGPVLAALERRPFAHPTIAYVGRVTTAKGVEVAYRALALLRARHRVNARLVVAGPCRPAMSRRLGALAEELGIAGHVELVGPLDTDGLGELLQGAHAVVVPTVEMEAFGLVCVEAALARAPIVASRLGGIPEAFEHDRHALLFEPGDVGGCAAALAVTLTDEVATSKRCRRAFERASDFSLERYLDESERLIADAMELMATRPATALRGPELR